MRKNILSRAISGLLAMLMLAAVVLSTVSCSAPKLEEVKDDFARLIEESMEVNRILFGDGLSAYGDMSYHEESGIYYSIFYTKKDGKLCAYYDKGTGEYVTLRFGDKGETGAVYSNDETGVYLYPTELEYSDHNKELPDALLPTDYNFVRTDEVAVTVKEITDIASAVYSEDYLADVFETLMGGLDEGTVITDETFIPRYKEVADTETGKKYLVKANQKLSPPLAEEIREYDIDTMTVMKNSRKNFVNVEISSYGTYADLDEGKVKVGWSTVRLSFVKQNGEWRLDSPTY
jgi:hypothetical protein